MDTQLHKTCLRIERKQITFEVQENQRGTFLQITEEVCGYRNAIIVPLTGIELFRDALNEVIKLSKSPVESRAILPLGQLRAGKPVPDGSAD